MWPFDRKRRHDERVVQLRDTVRGVAALAVRPIFGLPGADDATEPPTEMRLLVAGVNRTQKGDFLFDEQAAAEVLAFWADNKVDLTFDYEHQALAEPPVEAPASCYRWVPEVRDGELWATGMCWTSRASDYIRAKEYRYWSPALIVNKETMRVEAILNCALTNLPATKGIAPLVAASATAKEKDMETEKLVADLRTEIANLKIENARLSGEIREEDTVSMAVGLRSGAGRADRLGAVSSLALLRKNLYEATGKTSDAEALGAANAWKSEAGEVAKLRADYAKREDDAAASDMEKAFEDGVASGKLPKSPDHEIRVHLRKSALAIGGGKATKDGVAYLRADIATRSQFVTVTPTPGDGGGSEGAGLTAAETSAVKAWGQNLEVAARAKAEIERQKAARTAGR